MTTGMQLFNKVASNGSLSAGEYLDEAVAGRRSRGDDQDWQPELA